jgi:hypothetical protein
LAIADYLIGVVVRTATFCIWAGAVGLIVRALVFCIDADAVGVVESTWTFCIWGISGHQDAPRDGSPGALDNRQTVTCGRAGRAGPCLDEVAP